MLTPLDIYDDDLPDYSSSILQQLKDGQGMVRSALHVGLAVGSIIGVAAMCASVTYDSLRDRK